MNLFFDLIIFVLGLCAGSFINMLVYRTAVDYKITKNKFGKINKHRSFCDFCGRQLRWHENVPVVSWLVLRGKSDCCQQYLPYQYPLVEILMGVVFWVIGQILPMPQLMLGWLIVSLLIFSIIFDVKYLILPDFSTYILIAISFLGLIFDEKNIVPYLLSAIGASGFLAILYWLTKGKGMGFGDVKLAVFMGLFLGWPNILVATYVAFVAGAVVGLGLIIGRKVKRKSPIPFGPFLIGATVVAWGWGKEIIKLFIGV